MQGQHVQQRVAGRVHALSQRQARRAAGRARSRRQADVRRLRLQLHVWQEQVHGVENWAATVEGEEVCVV